MGEDQLPLAPYRRRPSYTASSIVENVNVERAWTHALPLFAAGRPLELFDKSQHLSRG